jgi:transcriptional adapter 2-alpha
MLAASKRISLNEILPKKRVKRHNSVDGAGTPWALQSHPANHEITGYMPGRGEFEVEFENEAEAVVKDLVFLEDDTVFDIQLKLAMLEIYSGILDRREARRAFVHQHGLIDFKKHTALDKSRSKEERELFNHVKAFARFVRLDDFQVLLDGLVKEEELRRRIAQLQEWRRNGLRSLDQVNSYEAERKHLELYLKGGSALPKTTALQREPFPLPSSKANLLSSHVNVPQVDPSALANLGLGKPFAAVPAPSFQAPTPTGSVVSNGSRKASMPLNISHAEGVDMLSEKEREICSILRLYPRLYITIKDTLIKESLRLGGLKRAQARASVKIDVNKTSKLYDFFITAGWIKPPASGE